MLRKHEGMKLCKHVTQSTNTGDVVDDACLVDWSQETSMNMNQKRVRSPVYRYYPAPQFIIDM